MSRAGEPSEDSPGLEVGRVSKAHGITGELRIVPHWESSDALEQVSEIWLTLKDKRTAYAVERARAVPRAYLVKLRGVDDRNAAEALRGARVFVPRSSFPTASADEYYWVDLIGLAVVNREGVELGAVKELLSTGPQTVLVLEYQAEGKSLERMIPFVSAYVDTVDVPGKRITVDWQPDY